MVRFVFSNYSEIWNLIIQSPLSTVTPSLKRCVSIRSGAILLLSAVPTSESCPNQETELDNHSFLDVVSVWTEDVSMQLLIVIKIRRSARRRPCPLSPRQIARELADSAPVRAFLAPTHIVFSKHVSIDNLQTRLAQLALERAETLILSEFTIWDIIVERT